MVAAGDESMGQESIMFVQIAAIVLWLKASFMDTRPDALHCHDWMPWSRYLMLMPPPEEMTCLLSFLPEEASAWLQLPELKVSAASPI